VIRKTNFYLLILLFFVTACSSIPKYPQNACKIFGERYLWWKSAKKAEEKWGIPIYIQLAIIKQESGFDWLARQPRHKLFKIIPYKRKSSSRGYSGALKGTFRDYKKETGRKLATRMRFADATDFIGWYLHKASKELKISKKDARRLYLSYYLGASDYKNYKENKKAIIYAKRVRDIASDYRKQLTMCRDKLNRKKYIIY